MARRRGRSTPVRIRSTKKVKKAAPKKPRNRAAQDATLINLRAVKKQLKVVDQRSKDNASQNANLATALVNLESVINQRIDGVIEAGKKLERMVFPLQEGGARTVSGPGSEKVGD